MDKLVIDELAGICKFSHTMDEEKCTEISFHDDNYLFGGTIRKHPHKDKITKLIARLPHLKHLNMRKCKVGNLPNICSTNLEYLDISCNDIEHVPDWVTQQPFLRFLNMGANKIKSVPDLSHLPIEVLKLHKNRIKNMPAIGKRIKSLNIFINEIDDIPQSVLELPLEVFTFGLSKMNKISSLASLTNLKWLTLTLCDIEFLPDDICWLSNLEGLQLAKNKLKKLPNKIGNLTKLKAITLYSNEITDLPSSFFDLSLTKLNLSINPIKNKEQVMKVFGDIDFIRI